MSEFSRRVDVQVIKDEPQSRKEWEAQYPDLETDDADQAYAYYLEHHQPYRWRAVAANNEPIAHGESYFNLADCINAVELLMGDDTTVWYAPMFGEERGDQWLRYGKTDRDSQAAQGE